MQAFLYPIINTALVIATRLLSADKSQSFLPMYPAEFWGNIETIFYIEDEP